MYESFIIRNQEQSNSECDWAVKVEEWKKSEHELRSYGTCVLVSTGVSCVVKQCILEDVKLK